jgi:hypothetical protein
MLLFWEWRSHLALSCLSGAQIRITILVHPFMFPASPPLQYTPKQTLRYSDDVGWHGFNADQEKSDGVSGAA